MKQQETERKDYILPADFKKGWIDALKSGEYNQVEGSFYEVGCGYCALGVAIVECLSIDKSFLAGMSTLDNICENYKIPYADVKIPWRYGSSDRTVRDTVELEDMIMEMNDGDGASFNQIADWIDENVEEMEK
tara:strand:- start:346 stop:744 length:399 start_codon:yes stop_codon:yes gene_type:complete